MNKWTRKEITELFKLMIKDESNLYRHPAFRNMLSRDENLYVNQITREANSSIAYDSVDFDIDNISDEEFWKRVQSSRYSEILDDNAATNLLKMLKKNEITE